ncbi:hypothetical protein [Mucilaginibacter sp.]|uniref:hypothetical protein n=1 Tax=Mucilaginibacter sp. TaxID=1882438 RepID=UPI0032649E89
MKYLKILAVTIIALFAFEGAKAQAVVRVRAGAPVHQRTVVTTRPVYRHAYRRTVVATRPVVYHRPYRRAVVVTRPAYRRTVAYHRPYKRVVVRHY